MNAKIIDIKTKDGVVPCHFFVPPQKGNRPAVIFYMDGIGIRPALCGMAERLASNCYYVLLPNLYYRSGPTQPFDAATAFKEGPERDRLMALFGSINNKLVMEDTASFLDFLGCQAYVAGQKIGCVGYCMGGAFALSAAGTFPGRIAAAAALHGARLATDQPDSPHLLAPKMRASVYIGIAGIDPHFTLEEKQRLESALQSAGVRHTVEVYPDVKHGFAVNDTPVYSRPASERHWQQILKLFKTEMNPSTGAPAGRYSAKRMQHHVDFFCDAPAAKKVSLVGDFNEWDPAATPMRRMADGRWMASLELHHGHHQYLFLVDGTPKLDPKASGIAHNERNERVSLMAVS